MKKIVVTLDHLSAEIKELGVKYSKFKDEDLFVLWFIRAYLTDNLEDAANAITNGPNDKGIDAVFIDHRARLVCLVQGKFRKKLNRKSELRNDILGFVEAGLTLENSDDQQYRDFVKGADPFVLAKLKDARKRLHNHGYHLALYYVTLGVCSSGLRREAERMIRFTQIDTTVDILDGKRTMVLLKDYLDGVAPPIPRVDLEMEKGQGISVNNIFQRYDNRSNIESWVFSMTGSAIADLFDRGGLRLFARNVRGFLGENTPVNLGMDTTLKFEATNFFYYNNGITIICDQAKKESYKGKDILRVQNPQIINGQQTTRMLSTRVDESRKASVLVKVIQVPRDSRGEDEFDMLVSKIVAGTNWQNSIRAADLMSNDRRQIELEREFRKLRYLYLRKRQARSEARAAAGGKYYWTVYKEDLAQAVAGCDLDPVIARSGKDNLFREDLYNQVFPNSDPNYFLPRYLLAREVTYCAKGYPERGYVKWVVLNFIWSRLASNVRSAKNAVSFRILCENQDGLLVDPLNSAIQKVFIAALRYYKENRGTGETAVDISTFFRSKKGRDKELRAYWQSPKNHVRKHFDKAWQKVERAITT